MALLRNNNKSKLYLFLIPLFSISFFSSCSRNIDLSKPSKVIFGDIFSNRPQTKDQFLAIIRLPGKALLETAEVNGRTTILDGDEKARLESEQKELENKLAQLSPSIQIIYRYKLALNALVILAPAQLEKEIRGITGVSYVEGVQTMGRPEIMANQPASALDVQLETKNSTTHIGAKQAREKFAVSGKNIRVGIIDTGIDYTHAMLGGEGTEEAFKAINPKISTVSFPNQKVVGGIDLVGTDYDANSPVFSRHIPLADQNPIDESGHGTHVAGTVAGMGDGVNSYTGVAPDANLYAIKVFGKDGSTSDIVVIAALEWAMDPNADGDLSDKLDVVNLSLGSNYGRPNIPYSEAVKNVDRGGLVVVASAGNSGPNTFVTGAPASSIEAFSVAASIDSMDHNWKFSAVELIHETQDSPDNFIVEAIEAGFSKPIKEVGDLVGEIIFVGDAATDFSDELKAQLNGKVALIDRGKVDFTEKVRRASEAGAIGVIVANNIAGDAFAMGGSGSEPIPAIMVGLEQGNKLKEWLKSSIAKIKFQTPHKIERPELIDTITSFSSQGPRVEDAFFKPEISAPGANIISADMGRGAKTVKMSGTSMAAPHVAGVMALIMEKFPELKPAQFKSLVMGGTKTLLQKGRGEKFPLSLQGPGLVDVMQSIQSELLTSPSALSLGQIGLDSAKTIRKQIEITNITDHPVSIKVGQEFSTKILKIKSAESLVIEGRKTQKIDIDFLFKKIPGEELPSEVDGYITLQIAGGQLRRVPFLARFHEQALLEVGDLKIKANSISDDLGALSLLEVKNQGFNAKSDVLLFNLLGTDPVKTKVGKENSFRNLNCDLVAAGQRIIKKDQVEVLQIAVQLANALNFWVGCEVSVLVDANADGIAEQEIAGILEQNLPGQGQKTFSTFLLDATKVRELRRKFEDEHNKNHQSDLQEDYGEAIIGTFPFILYPHSSVGILEVPVDELAANAKGEMSLRVGILDIDQGAIEPDDFLGDDKSWAQVSMNPKNSAFIIGEEKTTIESQQTLTLALEKGEAKGDLMVLMPQNPWWGAHGQMLLPLQVYERE